MLKGQERARQDITNGELQAIAKADIRGAAGGAPAPSSARRLTMPSYIRRPTARSSTISSACLIAGDTCRCSIARGRPCSRRAKTVSESTTCGTSSTYARGGGISPIRQDDVDRHLRAAGLELGDEMRWRLQLVLFPAYRDAYADAQAELEPRSSTLESGTTPTPVVVAAAPVVVTPAGVTEPPGVPADWPTCTPIQAAESMVLQTPHLLERRHGDKRDKEAVGEHSRARSCPQKPTSSPEKRHGDEVDIRLVKR